MTRTAPTTIFDFTSALQYRFEELTQFYAPHIMPPLSGYMMRPLSQTQSLINTAIAVADMEIEKAKDNWDEDAVSLLNPFRRKERSQFYGKIQTAIERAAAAQTAAAFSTSEERVSDR